MFINRKRLRTETESLNDNSISKRNRTDFSTTPIQGIWSTVNHIWNKFLLMIPSNRSTETMSSSIAKDDEIEYVQRISTKKALNDESSIEIIPNGETPPVITINDENEDSSSFLQPSSTFNSFRIFTAERQNKDKFHNESIHVRNRMGKPRTSSSVYDKIFHPDLKSPSKRRGLRSKFSGINESIRLLEKDKYKRLLSRYSTGHFSFSSSALGTPTLSSRKKMEVIDLGDDVPIPIIESTPIPSFNKASSNLLEKNSNSIQIVKERVKVNSLEAEFQAFPSYNDDYLTDLLSKYRSRKNNLSFLINKESVKRDYDHEKTRRSYSSIEERMRKYLAITEVELEEEESRLEKRLPSITEEMESIISKATSSSSSKEDVLVVFHNISITRRDIETLKGLNWLNDEVINFYFHLIVDRSSESFKSKNYPKVYAMSTFFYPKLMAGGHSSLRRWTRKVDLFSYDLIFIPVHLGMHWTLASIDLSSSSLFYYDSMGGDNIPCLEALQVYLEAEHVDKKKVSFDASHFKKILVKDNPQQMNGSDCGMFTCKTAEYLSRNSELSFSQKDMPYFRKTMIYEIIVKKLLDNI